MTVSRDEGSEMYHVGNSNSSRIASHGFFFLLLALVDQQISSGPKQGKPVGISDGVHSLNDSNHHCCIPPLRALRSIWFEMICFYI